MSFFDEDGWCECPDCGCKISEREKDLYNACDDCYVKGDECGAFVGATL